MNKVFFRLRQIAIEFREGVTLSFGHLQPVRKGWVVRMNGATDFEGEDGMFKALQIAQETTKTIAGSQDGDIELWDVVQIFNDEEKATKAGLKNGQMAIYQIETGRLKWLK